MKSLFKLVSVLYFSPICQTAIRGHVYLWISCTQMITTLRTFSVHINQPMFPVLSCFESVCLGFKPLKVGQLPLLQICMWIIILGSHVWQTINLDQLTQMIKFLLRHILGVRNFMCSRFELMTNPFDQFSNAIPYANFQSFTGALNYRSVGGPIRDVVSLCSWLVGPNGLFTCTLLWKYYKCVSF